MQQYELRNPANAARICALLSDGLSLRKVAKELGCSEAAIRQWSREDTEFASQYARSRDDYSETRGDEIIDLADEAYTNPELVNALRLMIDARKWVLSKQLPKKYGDKLDVNHGGQKENPQRLVITWDDD
jgi:hypothetical protein